MQVHIRIISKHFLKAIHIKQMYTFIQLPIFHNSEYNTDIYLGCGHQVTVTQIESFGRDVLLKVSCQMVTGGMPHPWPHRHRMPWPP